MTEQIKLFPTFGVLSFRAVFHLTIRRKTIILEILDWSESEHRLFVLFKYKIVELAFAKEIEANT